MVSKIEIDKIIRGMNKPDSSKKEKIEKERRIMKRKGNKSTEESRVGHLWSQLLRSKARRSGILKRNDDI